MELRELFEEKGRFSKITHDITDKAEKENRGLNDEEKKNYDAAFGDLGKVNDRIKLKQQQDEIDRAAAAEDAERTRPQGADSPEVYQEQRARYRKLWVRDHSVVVRSGPGSVRSKFHMGRKERERMLDIETELRESKSYAAYMKALTLGQRELTQEEQRDLMMGSDPAGGFTVPPEQFMAPALARCAWISPAPWRGWGQSDAAREAYKEMGTFFSSRRLIEQGTRSKQGDGWHSRVEPVSPGRRLSEKSFGERSFEQRALMNDAHSTPDLVMERLVGLHQILPCQYFDLSGGHRLTAEQRLMLALLADAINVFQQGLLSRATRKRLLYVDAERWIMAAKPVAAHAFSFDTVCDALGICPIVLRRRLLTWKHRMSRVAETRPARHLRLKITPRAQQSEPRPLAPLLRALDELTFQPSWHAEAFLRNSRLRVWGTIAAGRSRGSVGISVHSDKDDGDKDGATAARASSPGAIRDERNQEVLPTWPNRKTHSASKER